MAPEQPASPEAMGDGEDGVFPDVVDAEAVGDGEERATWKFDWEAEVVASADAAAADAAKSATAADEAAKAATAAAATSGNTAGAAAAAAKAAAAAAQSAAVAATAAATVAKAVAAGAGSRDGSSAVTWLASPWPFLRKGGHDFKSNIKRTWPVVIAFIAYLLGSTSALYGFLRVSAQVSSWIQALYSTWISMSTAGELTTRSSKWVWVLGAANSLVGLLFFGFIVWLVTTSLYQRPNS